MTDSLTARLRDLTPSLFSQDDAIASKATELVTMATTIKNRYEQLSMLRESLKVHCYRHTNQCIYTLAIVQWNPLYCGHLGPKIVPVREVSSFQRLRIAYTDMVIQVIGGGGLKCGCCLSVYIC